MSLQPLDEMEVQLESGSICNGGEIANDSSFSKTDISILNAELISMDEIKESLHIKITNIQKSCSDQNMAELFLEISNELGMISNKSEKIKTILKKIKIYTEKHEDMREETEEKQREDIKAENAGKLRLVPLEKLIAKTPGDEHIKKTVFMHSCEDKKDPIEIHNSKTAIKTSSKSWNACCVRIKRLQLPACMKNNLAHKMGENKKANSITTVDENMNGHKENTEDSPMTSDSEIAFTKTKKRQLKSFSESEESAVDTNFKKEKKKLKKTRSCTSSDSGDEKCEGQRKNIRKLIKTKNLKTVTKEASLLEESRRKRVEERQKMYNEIYSNPEKVEIDEVVLDFNEDTKETLLEVDKSLLKHLKPHQVSGIKFMWDACFETVKDCKEKSGSGCILAHCMGLGKTLQIVALTHTLLVNSAITETERVLIISPLSTLGNWAREFAYWIEFAENKYLDVYDLSKYKDKITRIFKLNEWFQDGGVCIIGYDLYRILSNEKIKGLSKKHKETLQKSLVNPGPDLVVCDEGHLLKNEKTSLSQAVSKIRTQRRIVLTGTPLQNNLKEYYCMIQFIKPNLLGTYKEYLNRFVNPITNGQYTNSTTADIRLMKHRSHILHKMLEGCIQRRDYSVLAPYLPPKHEYVVFVTLSDVQKKLYHYYMTKQEDESSSTGGRGAKLFDDFQYVRRILTHPMNLRLNSDRVIGKNNARFDSSDSMEDFINDSEATSFSISGYESSNSPKTKRSTRAISSSGKNEICDSNNAEELKEKEDPSEWWTQCIEEKELNNLNHSPKLLILMEILQQSEFIGDKVLLFSQSLQSLDVIEYFLQLIDKKTKGVEVDGNLANFKGCWKLGRDYLRLDGSSSAENREKMCKKFNDVTNLQLRLFLISTKAGSLGINLVAANRVVIFDVSWNPSHDTQSIFRVYRFGQQKPCYIYRLIGLGAMEQKVYERQVIKQATAKRVIDEQQISRHYDQSDLQELYKYELTPTLPRETPKLPKDRLFAELLSDSQQLIYKYHEHDSLLENKENENLSEDERKAAWDEYEAEKNKPQMLQNAFSSQHTHENSGYIAGSLTSNKIFGIRNDILLRLLNIKISQDQPQLTNSQKSQLVPGYLQTLITQMRNGDTSMYGDLITLNNSLQLSNELCPNPFSFSNPSSSSAAGPMTLQPNWQNEIHQRKTPLFDADHVYEID